MSLQSTSLLSTWTLGQFNIAPTSVGPGSVSSRQDKLGSTYRGQGSGAEPPHSVRQQAASEGRRQKTILFWRGRRETLFPAAVFPIGAQDLNVWRIRVQQVPFALYIAMNTYANCGQRKPSNMSSISVTEVGMSEAMPICTAQGSPARPSASYFISSPDPYVRMSQTIMEKDVK